MKESKNSIIGKAGEDEVAKALEGMPGARLMRNLYVPCGNGRTAEIDILVITDKGLFPVECKAWGGSAIRGSTRLNDWSVRADPSSKPVKRYSPVKQAEGSSRTLSRYLKLPVSKRPHSFIAFTSENAKLTVTGRAEHVTIVQGAGALRSALERRIRLRNEIFTDAQLQSIIERLEKTTEPSDKTKESHVKQAKRSQRRRLAIKESRRKARRKVARRKPATAVAKRTIVLLGLLGSCRWLF